MSVRQPDGVIHYSTDRQSVFPLFLQLCSIQPTICITNSDPSLVSAARPCTRFPGGSRQTVCVDVTSRDGVNLVDERLRTADVLVIYGSANVL